MLLSSYRVDCAIAVDIVTIDKLNKYVVGCCYTPWPCWFDVVYWYRMWHVDALSFSYIASFYILVCTYVLY